METHKASDLTHASAYLMRNPVRSTTASFCASQLASWRVGWETHRSKGREGNLSQFITSNGDLPLYTSALAAAAPTMNDNILSAIGRTLVAPQTQESTGVIGHSMLRGERVFHEELLKNYDLQLGVDKNPNPNFFSIVFMLSKRVPSRTIKELENANLKLRNPWLRLAARVVARLNIPDGLGLPMGWFRGHRVHNMIAALSLLRYTQGLVMQYIELLLIPFLESPSPL